MITMILKLSKIKKFRNWMKKYSINVWVGGGEGQTKEPLVY